MRIQSPLSNLSDILLQIKESAIRNQSMLKKNESATRAALIDPLLRALGWDTAKTDMVEVEKTLDQTRVDYALYDINAMVRVIIEAKSLNTNLTQPSFIMNLVNYAFTYKIQDIFLTDGAIWQHFTNFQPGNVKIERTLDIFNDNLVDCAAYLVQQLDAAKFWPQGETISQLAQQITQLESRTTTLQQEIDRLKASIVHPIPSIQPRVETNLETTTRANYTDLDKLINIAGKRPSHFRLPDGTEVVVKRWRDILLESCKFVLKDNPNITIPFPDRAGKKVSLFNTVKPATGISYITEEYNGQTIFIYVNYDASNCVSNAIYILQQTAQKKFITKAAVSIVEDGDSA